jgi:hypothetical protein
MGERLRASVGETLRDAVPFIVITAVWIVLMLIVYGTFLVTKPADLTYDPWVHASVFLVPGIGFLGHILHQAIHGRQYE